MNSPDLPSLAALLKAARGPRPVPAVAVAAKVSRRSIYLYESGTLPKLTTLLRLIDAYGLTVAGRGAILSAHMRAASAVQK